jgi:hypothetical protein
LHLHFFGDGNIVLNAFGQSIEINLAYHERRCASIATLPGAATRAPNKQAKRRPRASRSRKGSEATFSWSSDRFGGHLDKPITLL